VSPGKLGEEYHRESSQERWCGGNEIINMGAVSDFIASEDFCDLLERLTYKQSDRYQTYDYRFSGSALLKDLSSE
jgi:hypothetical protein